MTREDAAASVAVVSTVAGLGLLLPAVDKVWSAHPHDHDVKARLRTGEAIYLSVAAFLTLLSSYANRSSAPFVVGFGLACIIVALQEYALKHPGKGE